MKTNSFLLALVLPASFAFADVQLSNPLSATKEFAFIDCSATVTTDGITVFQKLKVNLVTDAAKKPLRIKGNYSFYNETVGVHGSAELAGTIRGRYSDTGSGYSSIALKNGKLNFNAEGDLQLEKLMSVGFDSSKTRSGYYASVAGAGSRYTGVTGCSVSNLALYNSITLL